MSSSAQGGDVTVLHKATLGEVLVTQGVLTPERLQDALMQQQRTGRKLGQILIDSNYATEEQIAQALAAQQNLSYIDLRRFNLDSALAQRLPELLARQHRAVILEDKGSTYRLAMADPFQLLAQDALARVLGRPVEITVAAENQLISAIDTIYQRKEQLNEFARALESDVDLDGSVLNVSQINAAVDDPEAPVAKLLQTMFREAVQMRASDIHIEPQERVLRVRFRIDGALHTQIETDLKIAPTLVVKLKLLAGLDIAEKRLPQDGRLTVRVDTRQLDIRMSTMPTQYGESLVMRILIQSQGLRELSGLGMSDSVYQRFLRLIRVPNGIVLSTGPTGSGKTTTLYGALSQINNPDVKILTCEDPIEYRISGVNQVQVNERIGLGFARVLRSFLRQDPDVLLVGEIRDSETAEVAVRAAMTGHLVLSTLHTNDAVSAPLRLMDMGVPGFLLASSLRAVLSQRLLRLVCTHCAEPHTLSSDEHDWLHRVSAQEFTQTQFVHGRGCSRCNHSGYHGRLGIFELLEVTPELSAALSHQSPVEFERLAKSALGRNGLVHDGLAVAAEGKTTLAEVMKHTLFFD